MSYFLQIYIWFTCVLCYLVPLLDGELHRNDTQNDEKTNSTTEKREVLGVPNEGELFEGDIMMDERFRRIVTGDAEAKKSALTYGGMMDVRWPNGIVYYKVAHSFALWSRLMLAKAIYQIERRTCVRFKKRKHESDYIWFTSTKDGCFSYVGRLGGKQKVNLEKDCTRLGTFEHEIMHALGMIHEHSRPDRDRFIRVQYGNVDPEDINNFQKYPYFETDNLDEDFNFASVMLYPNDAFSKNGRNTIVAINEPQLQFGQRKQFSVGDIREINKFYNCKRYLQTPDYDGLVKNYHTGANNKYNLGWFDRFMEVVQFLLQDLHFIFVF